MKYEPPSQKYKIRADGDTFVLESPAGQIIARSDDVRFLKRKAWGEFLADELEMDGPSCAAEADVTRRTR